ncbi:YfcE family phosphodiesterase [Patescibacteria group bacterium]
MKIAILSDSHDNWQNLNKAIKLVNKNKCEILLFAGDLITPSAIANILEKFSGKEGHLIFGNNEGEKFGYTKEAEASKKLTLHGDTYEGIIDGVKIFMNHYPRIAELATKSQEFDLCIHGHNHTAHSEKVGTTILLNPGEIAGVKEKPGFAIFDTKSKKIEFIPLK